MKMNERGTSEFYDNGILVQGSRQVSNSIYRAMFYGLLSERDTIKRWVPSHKTWSLVLRFTETVSVSVPTTINILLCVKELERKLQSITENIYLGYVVLRGDLRRLNQ